MIIVLWLRAKNIQLANILASIHNLSQKIFDYYDFSVILYDEIEYDVIFCI